MTDQSRNPRSGTDYEPASGVPRWVKLTGILLAVVVLLVVVVVLIGGGGGHGPRRHQPSGGAADPTRSADALTEGHVPPADGHE